MSEKYDEEKNVLFFLCQAPVGLTLKDIKDKVTESPAKYGCWDRFLEDLIISEATYEEDLMFENEKESHGFKVI